MAKKQFLETLNYVVKVANVLSKEESKEKILHLVESIRNADGLEIDPKDEDRRVAMLNLNAIALAQQATWMAFSAGDLTDNLEREFRELPDADAAQAEAKAAEESVKSEEEGISEQIKEFRERAKKFDIVRAVCNGQDAKEAKKQQEEYEKNAAQGMRG